ncbi:hypothetical protein ACFL5Q_04125 [Planctomycetota bacterium]
MQTIEAELSALTTELKQVEVRRARRCCEERENRRRLSALTTEVKQIEARRASRRCTEGEDRRRLSEINAAIHRLKLKALEGEPSAVRLGYRVPITDRCAHLNDCRGTITRVRRTVASVTFHVPGKPVGEKWTIPLRGLKPVEEEQDECLEAVLESVEVG